MSSDNTDAQQADVDAVFSQALDQLFSTEEIERKGNVRNNQGGWENGNRTETGLTVHRIQDVSHTHEAVMNWLIANPQLPLGTCAAHFGYSRSWLSTLIHSDVFQARLREKQDQFFSQVSGNLTTKLTALADVGIEKLQEKMETSEDPRFLLEASKLALANLGFNTKPGAASASIHAQNVQQNFYVASPADLSAAREQMRAAGQVSSSTVPPLLPGDAPSIPAPAQPAGLGGPGSSEDGQV